MIDLLILLFLTYSFLSLCEAKKKFWHLRVNGSGLNDKNEIRVIEIEDNT